jgi:serine/threonine protein kinase
MNGPEPGLEILPGLTLLRRLGRGGMGEAWLARDAERGIDVVAKLLPGDAPQERLALLRREARLVRKLNHPRIVPVYGFHSGERFCAVTLRHMAGGDAGARRGADPVEIVRLGRDVADALAYLHDLGVVHRDVKVSNVLLDEAGRAHLADFGIATVAHADDDGIVVRGGGSRASMSPQQRAGETPQPADDLYALGVLLFELLSGETPQLDDISSAGSAPALPEGLKVPARLQGLVASLLAPSPEARPRSATAVRDELDAISAESARTAAVRDRQAINLQPPPRVGDPALAPGRPEPPREIRLSGRREDSTGQLRLALLGGLVVLAIAAAVWLPRWAEAPAAPSPAGSPTPAPSPSTAPLAGATRAEEDPPAPEVKEPPRPALPPPAGAVPSKQEEARPVPAATPAPAPEPTPDLQAQARTLAGHREQGALLESREDWRGALAQYTAALAIDPHLTFALEGRERADKRAALVEALDFHLQRPHRLSAAAVAREAEGLLERARGAEPPGPALQARIVALEAALAVARTPVAVVIESDGLTELTLSRVGRLGPLTRRSLELVPGHYTLTGTRRGYRDVRRQFSLMPGAPTPTVSLRCQEAL